MVCFGLLIFFNVGPSHGALLGGYTFYIFTLIFLVCFLCFIHIILLYFLLHAIPSTFCNGEILMRDEVMSSPHHFSYRCDVSPFSQWKPKAWQGDVIFLLIFLSWNSLSRILIFFFRNQLWLWHKPKHFCLCWKLLLPWMATQKTRYWTVPMKRLKKLAKETVFRTGLL